MPGYTHILEAVIQGELHGSVTNNVWHFGTNNAAPDVANLVTQLTDLIDNQLKTATSSEQKYQSIIVRQLAPVLLDAEVFPLDPPREGTPFANALPSFNAALVSIKTGLGGRSHRGRIFFPGVQQGDQGQSVFTGAGLAKWAAVAARITALFIPAVDPAADREFNIGVLSRKIAGTPPNFVNGFFVANRLIARPVVATMHSRKKGVGV